jgi:tetratricopeptide (TPR) repeat protein
MEETSPKGYFIKGKEMLRDGNMNAACKNFYKAYIADMKKPEYLSFYGLTAAISKGEIKLGLELCTRAIKLEFYKPEFYVNLAKVYDKSGNKKGAITALKKGAKYDTKGEEIHNMLVELGVRKRPVIPFFKRSNPLNKILGIFFRVTLPRFFSRKGPKS